VRFVLDALMRKVIDDSKSISTHRPLDTSIPHTHVGIGLWPEFLDLQNNELALLRSKPYLLESQLLSYRFLRHFVMTSQSRSSYSQKKSKVDLTNLDVDYGMHPIERLRGYLSTPTITRSILGRDYGNVFGIWDTSSSEQGSEMLGWGAYVFGSYFNHGMHLQFHLMFLNQSLNLDCSPNLKKSRDKRGIAFYTIRDVYPGEELCIAYIDETASLNERIESLQKDWFFTCRCTRCSKETEVPTG
jgi:hypothetical protein